VYFNVLDGGMVVLAIFTFNFAHPGFLLEPQSRPPTKEEAILLESKANSFEALSVA
jgi:hypothetical protein